MGCGRGLSAKGRGGAARGGAGPLGWGRGLTAEGRGAAAAGSARRARAPQSPPAAMTGCVADGLLDYKTAKFALTRNRRVGLLHRLLQLGVLGYLLG